MRLSKNLRATVIVPLCLTLVVPVTRLQGDETPAVPPGGTIVDVDLGPDGILQGTILDEHGTLMPRQKVLLCGSDSREWLATSDGNGRFQFPLATGGTYRLTVDGGVTHVRCWKHGAAPPHATSSIMIGGHPVVRGQVPPTCWGLSNPWVIAGLTVVAIAVPVALYQNRDDRPDASE